MIILSIDPGSYNCGYAVMDGENKVVHFGVIHSKGLIYQRVENIIQTLEAVRNLYNPEVIVVESTWMTGKSNVALYTLISDLKTWSESHGAVATMNASSTRRLLGLSKPVESPKRPDFKKAVAEYVQNEFDLPTTLDQDIYDAIALGLAYYRKVKEDAARPPTKKPTARKPARAAAKES